MTSIKIYLRCDECGREYKENEEDEEYLRAYAREDGWVYEKVENGSFWDFCPKCRNKE